MSTWPNPKGSPSLASATWSKGSPSMPGSAAWSQGSPALGSAHSAQPFAEKRLDDTVFGPAKDSALSVRAFDAFPKTKPSYQRRTSSGGVWTVALVGVSCLLGLSEISRWWTGQTSHTFSVEKGISHDLQINIDMVVAMKCEDLRINVQDAAGDRVLADATLNHAATSFGQWGLYGMQERRDAAAAKGTSYEEEDVHDYLGVAKKRRKFAHTPSIPRHLTADSCRIFGSMEGNKVQGDFHITARGHGYLDFGQHLPHEAFNFSHKINELSFGPFYPSLANPLDDTYSLTESRFYKYQYFLSVVPTIYTTDSAQLSRLEKLIKHSPSATDDDNTHLPSLLRHKLPNTVFTNQYAVTEQSREVPERAVPGIFLRFDIEPILLTIAEERGGFLALLVRLVNVISGILVAGGWCYQMTEWTKEVVRKKDRKRADTSMGFLHGRKDSQDIKH